MRLPAKPYSTISLALNASRDTIACHENGATHCSSAVSLCWAKVSQSPRCMGSKRDARRVKMAEKPHLTLRGQESLKEELRRTNCPQPTTPALEGVAAADREAR